MVAVSPYWLPPISPPVGPGPLVVTVCNGTDYSGGSAQEQVERAKLLACSARGVGSSIDLVALTRGLNDAALGALHASGFRVLDATSIERSRYALQPLSSPPTPNTRKWPRAGRVQSRADHACTSVKLLAWNMTGYRSALLVDTDVVLRADPLPWMRRHAASQQMVAETEVASRGYVGFGTHMVLLRPNAEVFELLRASSVAGSFVPYTNSEQDVIETVFSPHLPRPPLPPHAHSKLVWCSGDAIHACNHPPMHWASRNDGVGTPAEDAGRRPPPCGPVLLTRGADACCPSLFRERVDIQKRCHSINCARPRSNAPNTPSTRKTASPPSRPRRSKLSSRPD